jgi:flagellar basal body-associated protein FliL
MSWAKVKLGSRAVILVAAIVLVVVTAAAAGMYMMVVAPYKKGLPPQPWFKMCD